MKWYLHVACKWSRFHKLKHLHQLAPLQSQNQKYIEDIAETVYAAYSLSKRSVVEEIVIRPQLGDI